MSFSIPVPVKAKDPIVLEADVQAMLAKGYDLHAPTAVLGGVLVTWMVECMPTVDYVLVAELSAD